MRPLNPRSNRIGRQVVEDRGLSSLVSERLVVCELSGALTFDVVGSMTMENLPLWRACIEERHLAHRVGYPKMALARAGPAVITSPYLDDFARER
jgi:hypothetical protein